MAKPNAEIEITIDAGPAERALGSLEATTRRATDGMGKSFQRVGSTWDRVLKNIDDRIKRMNFVEMFGRMTRAVGQFFNAVDRFLRLDRDTGVRLDTLSKRFTELGTRIAGVVGGSKQASTGLDNLATAINNIAVAIDNNGPKLSRFLDNYIRVNRELAALGALGPLGASLLQAEGIINALAAGGNRIGVNTFVGPELDPKTHNPDGTPKGRPGKKKRGTITIDPIRLTEKDAAAAQAFEDERTSDRIRGAFVSGELQGPLLLAKNASGELVEIEQTVGVSIDKIGAKYEELASRTVAFGREWGAIWKDIAANVGNLVGDLFAKMFTELFQGKNALAAIGDFFAGVITNLGIMLVQMGTAALVSGALSTAVPALAGLGGGPAGVAAGAAAVAAGIGMIAVGSAIGSAVNAPMRATENIPTTSGGGGSSGTRRAASGVPDGFSPGFGGGSQDVTINVNFNRPIDSRRAARELSDLLRNYGPLTPVGAGG